jgi:ubiquinone/menaquinone biosynthesis C-methylase UbiE
MTIGSTGIDMNRSEEHATLASTSEKASARVEAQKQWNTNPCGALPTASYDRLFFERVEADRYRQQYWQRDYFDYRSFRGGRVLEIGVGLGTDLKQFARNGADCFGVDITDTHLQLTQKNFELEGFEVHLHKVDAISLPFHDNYFDCVYSFGVLHHIPDVEMVLAEAKRVLKPGGLLQIAVYHKWSAFHIFRKLLANGLCKGWLFSKGYAGLLATIESGADGIIVKPYVKLYSKAEVHRLLKAYEIEDISIHQLNADHFWPQFLVNVLSRFVPRLESRFGWYVACKARTKC